MKNFKPALLFLSFTILVMACQNDKSQSTSNPSTPSTETSTDPATTKKDESSPTTTPLNSDRLQSKDLVYAWVDKLNIRNTSNLKGKAISTVDSNDALEFSGERSKEKETIVLRGVAYEDSWLKVITLDKKEGWVFGGAVKEKEEKKGNAPITDTKFDFPHFGSFDLSQWKNLGTRTEGEEVDYVITTYQKGDQILEVTNSSMGEMHYGHSYSLMDGNKKVLKTRAFDFPGTGEIKELTETVKDYTSTPAKEYTRKQNLKKHFYKLNARPVMVNGTWSSKSI